MNSFKELCVHFEARRKSSSCIVGHSELRTSCVCYGHKYAKLCDKNKPPSVRAVVQEMGEWKGDLVRERWSISDVYCVRWARGWFIFRASLMSTTELFAYHFLGQQQFCIYHFYAFDSQATLKTNSTIVLFRAQVAASAWYVRDMHTLLVKSTHMMSSTRVSCGSEPFPLPVGSNLLLLFSKATERKRKKKIDDSVVCLKWPLHGMTAQAQWKKIVSNVIIRS